MSGRIYESPPGGLGTGSQFTIVRDPCPHSLEQNERNKITRFCCVRRGIEIYHVSVGPRERGRITKPLRFLGGVSSAILDTIRRTQKGPISSHAPQI